MIKFSIPTMNGADIVRELNPLYPRIKTPLLHHDAFQLLIATVLSAQCTDAQVNRVTPVLFNEYPTPSSMSKAPLKKLERIVKSTGFFHVKARRIKEISKELMEKFDGNVPENMEELLTLLGVGRKTANIVLSAGFDKIEGIAVDTHVFRLSRRIGLTSENTPEKIEQDLMKITPRELWPRLTLLLILHGRSVCSARSPECSRCVLSAKCLYYDTEVIKKTSSTN